MIGKKTLTAVSLAAFAFGLNGCGKLKKSKKAEDPNLELTISGSLSLSGETTALAPQVSDEYSVNTNAFGVTATDLSVYCVTFEFPPEAGTGSVSADGSFSLKIAGGIDSSVGCFILNDTTQVGAIVFEDSTQKDLSGGTSSSSRTAFSGNASLGAISLDLNSGKAVVDLSRVSVTKKTDASLAEGFDFTGTYEFQSPTGITQPKGYAAPCAKDDRNCKGPQLGQKVYLKRIEGKKTDDGKKVFAVMAWESQTRFDACGSKLGFSYADAKTNGQVDFSGSGVGEGAFTWATSYAEGWKNSAAKSRMEMPVSSKITLDGFPGMAQFVTSGFNGGNYTCANGTDCFQFHADSKEVGCKETATGQPIQVQDWSSINSCTTVVAGTNSILKKDTCTGTANGKAVTCIHIGGMFKGGTDKPVVANFTNSNWPQRNDFNVIASGTSCSAISDQLSQLRCYADFLQDAGRNDSTSCIRRINFNFGAESPTEFVDNKGPVKAFGQFVFEKFNYDSATSGSFRQEEEQNEGVDTGNGFTSCRVISRFTMSIQKTSGSSDLLAEFIQETRTADSKPACIAKYSTAQIAKSMFKLQKK